MSNSDETIYPYTNLFDSALRAAKAIDLAPIETPGGRAHIALPRGFELKDVTDPGRLDAHPAAKIVVDEKGSLIEYVKRFREPGTVLFADVDKGAIEAAIDYHLGSDDKDATTGARRHVATLKLRESEEFRRWNAPSGQVLDQAEFAEFLEENAGDIGYPEPATMIEIAREFSATIGAKFSGKVELSNGDRRFHYETETRVEDHIRVPREFTVSIPIYQGEEPMPLRAAFRYRVGGGGLKLGFEWRRVEYQRLALFQQIAVAVAEGTGAPVYFGRSA